MNYKEKGITIKQAFAVFILSTCGPIVRLIPAHVAKISKEASWVAPFVLVLFGIVTIFAVNKLINGIKDKDGKKVNIKNIDDTFLKVYGKILGRIICVIYLIWLILGTALQLRIFSERFVITLMVYAPIDFFIISMLILLFFILNTRIEAFGRFAQFYVPLIFGIFIIILIAISKDIDIRNLLPVTIYNTKEIFLGGFEIAGICSFFPYLFFFGEYIKDKQDINKNKNYAIMCVATISMIAILTTVGVFGHRVSSVFSQPFFMALKSIKVFASIERIESIFIAFWVIADLVVISFLMTAATNLCKNTFNLSNRKVAIIPLIFIVYSVVLIIGRSYLSLIKLSGYIVVPLNVLFGLVIPILSLIIAKVRKFI